MRGHFLRAAAGNRASAIPITYVGSTTTTESVSSITLPSGMQPGDLVIVYVGLSAVNTTPTPTPGWSVGQNLTAPASELDWFYKFMPDPVDTTATVDSSNFRAYTAVAFRNVDPVDPFSAAFPSAATGASGVPNPPSITTDAEGAIVALGGIDDLSVSVTAAPSGYSLAAQLANSARPYTTMSAYLLDAAPGAYDPGTFTLSSGSDEWIATTIGLKAKEE